MRKHGLTIDNLLAAEVVTADAAVVRANKDEHPDLFWGLRGGGGNFGIVTRFTYRLHPVGPLVLAGPIFYALDDAPEVLRLYRDFAADAPDELTTILTLRRAPALAVLPDAIHGSPVLVVNTCYAGPIDQGEAALRPLRMLRSPLADLVRPKPYTEHQSMLDATVPTAGTITGSRGTWLASQMRHRHAGGARVRARRHCPMHRLPVGWSRRPSA